MPTPIRPAHTYRILAHCCRRSLVALRHDLIALCPLAMHLARDPSLAERIDTTPIELAAADVIAAAQLFLSELDEIDLT